MRRFLGSIAVATACATTPTVAEPGAPLPSGRVAAAARSPDAAVDPAVPFSAFPIASACQAPLAVAEEVSRLLVKAAAHSTRSAACVDGPGRRVAATDVLVCPAAPGGHAYAVQAYYRMAVYPEGDTRGCGSGRDCSWRSPTVSEHLVELAFAADGAGGLVLVVPERVPGMPDDATPLYASHDGDCYGGSDPFVAAAVPSPHGAAAQR